MEKLIYDIGMHAGRDTEFYLQKGFRVLAVEADPAHVQKAKEKFKKEIADNRLVIIDKAIAPQGQLEVSFYTNNKFDDWGTIRPDWNREMSNDFTSIKVETVQLETLITEYGMPYYMKIDIEGADTLCLQSLQRMQAAPSLLSVELPTPSNTGDKETDCMEILCILYSLGYRRFKVSDQSALKYIRCPYPALEGAYVDYDFSGGVVSGPFGKELPGPFFSIDQVSMHYLNYFYKGSKQGFSFVRKVLDKAGIRVQSKGVFHAGGWFDIHAYL